MKNDDNNLQASQERIMAKREQLRQELLRIINHPNLSPRSRQKLDDSSLIDFLNIK